MRRKLDSRVALIGIDWNLEYLFGSRVDLEGNIAEKTEASIQNIRAKSQFLTDFAQKIRQKEIAFHAEEKRFEVLKSKFQETKKQHDYEKYANDAKLRVLSSQLQDLKVRIWIVNVIRRRFISHD